MKKYIGLLTEKGIVTRDYSWFKSDDRNRRLDSEALMDLEESFNNLINETEYPFQSPIVVYWVEGMERGVIQQGHHRFEVCKNNNRDINYVITTEYLPPSRNQEYEHQDWTTHELVESYSKEDIPSYKALQKLHEQNPKYSLIALTVFLNKSVTSVNTLRKRGFKINGDINKALLNATEGIKKFEEFNRASQRTDKSKEVIKAILNAIERPDFDWKYFIERTTQNSSEAKLKFDFKSISTYSKATALIQFFYNHNSRKNFYF